MFIEGAHNNTRVVAITVCIAYLLSFATMMTFYWYAMRILHLHLDFQTSQIID